MQVPQGFPLAGQINQANYAQFAAVLAQQAARQRQAQDLVAQQAQRAQQVSTALSLEPRVPLLKTRSVCKGPADVPT